MVHLGCASQRPKRNAGLKGLVSTLCVFAGFFGKWILLLSPPCSRLYIWKPLVPASVYEGPGSAFIYESPWFLPLYTKPLVPASVYEAPDSRLYIRKPQLSPVYVKAPGSRLHIRSPGLPPPYTENPGSRLYIPKPLAPASAYASPLCPPPGLLFLSYHQLRPMPPTKKYLPSCLSLLCLYPTPFTWRIC